jgi:hypothetical protein
LKLFKDIFEIDKFREQVLTDMHDETHKFEKRFIDFKEKGVENIVKKFLGGTDQWMNIGQCKMHLTR